MKHMLKFFPRIGILVLLPLLALSALMLHAQDASPEPTTEIPTEASESPLETEIPTEASESPVATELPTEAPSLEPTVEVIEATVIPETVVTDETEAPVETELPDTGIAPEPSFTLLVRELFDNGDTSPWNIGSAWSLVPSATGQAFQIINSTEPLELLKGDFYNVAVQASFLSDTADARLSIRNSAVGNYSLSLSPDGTVELYRSEVIVASALATASTSGQWRTLRISAVDGLIRASVDGIELLAYTDSAPLPPGTVRIFSGLDIPEANNLLLMDDFFLWVLVDELGNYPAPTAYWLPTEIPTEVAVTELAPTAEANGEVKDYSPFPPPTAEQLSQYSGSSTLGNDNFDGLEILFVPFTVSDDTIGDTLELGEPSSGCGVGMSNTVWFKYTPTITGSYRLSSAGSNFDTILAIYMGPSLGSLGQVGCNDDISATNLDSQFTVTLDVGNTYYIQLGGFNGRYGTYTLTMQLLGIAAPSVPTLLNPANAAKTNDTTPDVSWNPALNTYQYEVQWATNATFTANRGTAFVTDPVTTHTLPTLPNAAGQIYYWRVRAINGSGVASTFSQVRNFTLDTTLPNVPNLTAPANAAISTNSRPTLSWGAAAGANGYYLDLDDNSDFSSPLLTNHPLTSTNYVPPTSLIQGTYYWRLQSRDAAGNVSAESTVRSFTIKILSAPANNTVIFTSTGTASPVLRWAAVPGATSYTVQIDDDADFSSIIIDDGAMTTSYTAVNLTPGVYYWQVLPFGFYQSTPVYNTLTISPPALAAPGSTSVPNGTRINVSPEFEWDIIPGASEYEIQWATNTAFTANMQSAIVATNTYTLPALPNTAGTIYYYHIRTINNLGVPGAYGATRNFTLDTTAPAAANLVSPANGAITSDSTPTFTFQAVAGAQDYFIDIDNDSDFSSMEQSHQFFATNFTLTSSLPQGTYYWRVRTQEAAGNISTSTSRTITVKIATAPVNNNVFITGSPTLDVVLQWAAVDTIIDYTVQIDDASDFSTPILDLSVGNVLTYTALALAPGVYYWQVFPTGFAPANAVYSQFTISPPIVSTPGLAEPQNGERIGDSTPNLTWLGISGAYQYEVQWATNATFTANMQTLVIAHPTVTATLPTLPNATGTVYYWRVRMLNEYGVAGSYSAARTFTLDTTAPDVPAQLAPAANLISTNSRPILSWTAETGSAGYLLDLADNISFINPILNGEFVVTTSYTSPTSLPQGTYYWRVRSVDSVENLSALSPVRSFTIKILTAPANNAIITTGTPPNAPLLRWVAVAGATDYTVQIDDNSDFSSPLVLVNNTGITGTSYTVSPALGYGVYYWQVIPTGFEQTTAVYSTFTISPGALVPTNVFTPPNGTYTNDTTPDVTWGSVTNAVQYEVQWATNTAFTANMGSQIVSAPTTSLTLPVLPNTAGTVYYWRLRVINAVGVAGSYGAARNFRLDTVAPNVPALVSPTDGISVMTNPVQFRWNAAAGAFRYEIRYGTTNPPTIHILNLATTSYTSPSPMLLQSYYWQVRAVDQAGNASAWTTVREVKITSGNTAAPILNRYDTQTPTLAWTPLSWTSGGGYYQVQVDNNANFSSPEFSNNSISGSAPFVTTGTLSEGTWYWRVRACTAANVCGAWSTTGVFLIQLD